MNKRGQTIFVNIMIGIVVLLIALALAYPQSQVVSEARAEGQLNCSTATSYQDKANCVMVDISLPLFIGVTLGIVGYVLHGGI